MWRRAVIPGEELGWEWEWGPGQPREKQQAAQGGGQALHAQAATPRAAPCPPPPHELLTLLFRRGLGTYPVLISSAPFTTGHQKITSLGPSSLFSGLRMMPGTIRKCDVVDGG